MISVRHLVKGWFGCWPLVMVGLLLCGVVGYLVWQWPLGTPSQEHQVFLTASGFVPDTVMAEVGDTIVFHTNTENDFWPASDAHPSHSAYPDFDPQQLITSNNTWSYTFTEPGRYAYHDHINPLARAVIMVGKTAADCQAEPTDACWQNLILTTLDEEGIAAAFDRLVQLSDAEPEFLRDCHSYSHLLGEAAYEQYVAGKEFTLTPATALCGYGFYHGFMETLLLTSGDVAEARSFCLYADKQLRHQISGASTACFHGTGHGAVDGSDRRAWGDIKAMMAPGFAICQRVAETKLQHYLCATGVFNAIEILSHDPKYGLTEVQNNPFAVCYDQPDERLEACYTNMTPALSGFFGNIAAGAKYINEHLKGGDTPTIDGYTTNEMVTLSWFVEFIHFHLNEPNYIETGIALCRAQPTEDYLACIEGLSAGHLKYGQPGREYVAALAFCAAALLTDKERNSCYRQMLPRLGNLYSQERSRDICQQVPEVYRKLYCIY